MFYPHTETVRNSGNKKETLFTIVAELVLYTILNVSCKYINTIFIVKIYLLLDSTCSAQISTKVHFQNSGFLCPEKRLLDQLS